MTFSSEWERHWSELGRVDCGISTILQHMVLHQCGLDLSGQRVLELGCGHGNNIEWLQAMGADYWGIDGSEAAVDVACREWPQFAEQIAVCDFTRVQPFESPFDIVIDRAATPHNDGEAIRRTIDLVWDALGPGGLFFGVDWFSINHSEAERGTPDGDGQTKTGYVDGQFEGVGRVHFFGEVELAQIFHRFERLSLTERITRSPAPGMFRPNTGRMRWHSPYFDRTEYRSSVWDLIVRKPR